MSSISWIHQAYKSYEIAVRNDINAMSWKAAPTMPLTTLVHAKEASVTPRGRGWPTLTLASMPNLGKFGYRVKVLQDLFSLPSMGGYCAETEKPLWLACATWANMALWRIYTSTSGGVKACTYMLLRNSASQPLGCASTAKCMTKKLLPAETTNADLDVPVLATGKGSVSSLLPLL